MRGAGPIVRTVSHAALLLALAACAASPPAPSADPIFWDIRRAQTNPASCVSQLHTPTQSQQFIERVDGVALYVIVPRGGRTVAQIPGGDALPPEGAPFIRPLPDGTRIVGTVLERRDQRFSVQVTNPDTLRAMLEQAQDSTIAATTTEGPRPITQHRRCMVTLIPPGTGRS